MSVRMYVWMYVTIYVFPYKNKTKRGRKIIFAESHKGVTRNMLLKFQISNLISTGARRGRIPPPPPPIVTLPDETKTKIDIKLIFTCWLN